MSSILKKAGVIIVLLLVGIAGFACDIEIKVSDDTKKETYVAGDEIVVIVKIINTHRNCHEDISKAQIASNGCEITGATQWKETSYGVYERKLKVKVTEEGISEMQLICKRQCRKEGGYAKLTLTKAS